MGLDISVILPCRNEEKTISKCISQIKSVFLKENIKGEIIVSDSSSDNSFDLINKENVIAVKHNEVGYGIAILKGIEKATGKLIAIGDCDGTYNFSELPLLITKLNNDKCDLVIGSRIKGIIKKGAMPPLHRFLGNPILSKLLNIFFKTKVSDAHSGFRIITKKSLDNLNLRTTGMEFASEMIIKAAKSNLKISEVPITYSKRIGESKLKSISDGWRHLRFMLMFSPTYLFFIPGLLFMIIGVLVFGINHYNPAIFTNNFLGSFLTILGYQVITLGLYARIYATHSGFETHDELINQISQRISLEKSLLFGVLFILISTSLIIFEIPQIFIFTLLIIGFQTLFSAFFISMMVVEKKV